MNQDRTEWAGFHRAALSRPSRELLRRTLGCFQLEKTPPGVAVDLGCGSGADTLGCFAADGQCMRLTQTLVAYRCWKRRYLRN